MDGTERQCQRGRLRTKWEGGQLRQAEAGAHSLRVYAYRCCAGKMGASNGDGQQKEAGRLQCGRRRRQGTARQTAHGSYNIRRGAVQEPSWQWCPEGSQPSIALSGHQGARGQQPPGWGVYISLRYKRWSDTAGQAREGGRAGRLSCTGTPAAARHEAGCASHSRDNT